MKFIKREILSQGNKIPELKFEDQRLTSFAGLIIYQLHMVKLGIKNGLRACFRHLRVSEIYGHHTILKE